jgi:gamma-glutamylcyclotransferase (GGCT)/AIG2-like uncharacterized protein YtfP
MNLGDRWYFAYGSNLDVDQKQRRIGRIRQALRCRLPGYRLAFNKRGQKGQPFANIVPDDNAEVWGVVYLCNPNAMQDMDGDEGVAGGHYKHVVVRVVNDLDEELEAITYIAVDEFVCEPGRPSDEYLRKNCLRCPAPRPTGCVH